MVVVVVGVMTVVVLVRGGGDGGIRVVIFHFPLPIDFFPLEILENYPSDFTCHSL